MERNCEGIGSPYALSDRCPYLSLRFAEQTAHLAACSTRRRTFNPGCRNSGGRLIHATPLTFLNQHRTVKVNARQIAATHRNPLNMVCKGEFREDL